MPVRSRICWVSWLYSSKGKEVRRLMLKGLLQMRRCCLTARLTSPALLKEPCVFNLSSPWSFSKAAMLVSANQRETVLLRKLTAKFVGKFISDVNKNGPTWLSRWRVCKFNTRLSLGENFLLQWQLVVTCNIIRSLHEFPCGWHNFTIAYKEKETGNNDA